MKSSSYVRTPTTMFWSFSMTTLFHFYALQDLAPDPTMSTIIYLVSFTGSGRNIATPNMFFFSFYKGPFFLTTPILNLLMCEQFFLVSWGIWCYEKILESKRVSFESSHSSSFHIDNYPIALSVCASWLTQFDIGEKLLLTFFPTGLFQTARS